MLSREMRRNHGGIRLSLQSNTCAYTLEARRAVDNRVIMPNTWMVRTAIGFENNIRDAAMIMTISGLV